MKPIFLLTLHIVKQAIFILLLLAATTNVTASAQNPRPEQLARRWPEGVRYIDSSRLETGQIVTFIHLKGGVKYATAAAQRRHDRLVRNVLKVWPIAVDAENIFRDMEKQMADMPRAKQRAFVAEKEREVKKKYTPVLREMTFSQGKILIKLIDRQTSMTSYEILREMRGRFSASLWQGVAKLFEADLNASYDAEGEDRQIEEIITRIEQGWI